MRRVESRLHNQLRSPSQHWLRAAFVLLAVLVWLPALVSAATFTATLDRDVIPLGDSVTLTLAVEGGTPTAFPTPSVPPNVRIGGGTTSRNINIVNGQTTSTISQTFELTPTQVGDYVIPALKAEVDGQVLSTKPLTLRAVKDQDTDPLAFFKVVPPKKEVYLGEAVSVEFQVFIREDVANGEEYLQQFDAFSGCPIKAEGFTIMKTAHAQRRRARVGNATYGMATLVTSLTPVKTGPLTLSSLEVPLGLQILVRGQYDRDWFGRPVQRYSQKRVTAVADPVTLTALPLPKDNVPPDFNGAVGSFTLAVTAGPTNVAVGDPITAKIQISGHGPLESLALPEQAAWKAFKTYPPTTKIDSTDPLGLEGTKTFEQVVMAQSADVQELPPVSFSFFDPNQKQYRVLTQSGVALIVRPAGAAPVPVALAASRSAQDTTPPAQTIVEIKQRLGAVAQIGPPLVLRPAFLALQAVPVLALVSTLVWRRRNESLANNPRLRRQRQVAQVIREGLNELRQLAAQNKSDAFFATMVRLLQEQLGERLDLPASAITEAVIEERLRPRGVPETTLTSLQELFQSCNLARYAPVQTSQELAAFIPKLEAVLHQLQEVKA
jgi:hypothetical protein